jgi:acetyltransferase-like isoleucine patch superfamily enzyme
MAASIAHRLFSKIVFRILGKVSVCRSGLRAFYFYGRLRECGAGFSSGAGFSLASPDFISVGANFVTGKNVRLHAWPSYAGIVIAPPGTALINIGSGVFINDSSYITAAYGIDIGDNCLIGSNVLITDNSHGEISFDATPRIQQPLSTKGRVSIGNNVWICNNAVIASGVAIGDHCIVAANSVVTKSFPAGSLIAGVPAMHIRSLSGA